MTTRKKATPTPTFVRRPKPQDQDPEDQLTTKLRSLKIKSKSKRTEEEDDDDGARSSFDEMGLKRAILEGIQSYGLQKPAAIQELAIVPGIRRKDLILQAQSGMGKTAAMAIIVLQRVKPQRLECQAMILVPTRELAIQVQEVFEHLGRFTEVKSTVCIGGLGSTRRQDAELRRGGFDVIVGTLGRLSHIIREGIIDPLKLKLFAMDEADKMLMQHDASDDLKTIIASINRRAQVILMSATMPPMALGYAKEITRRPKEFLIPDYELTLEGIEQFYVEVGDDEVTKLETLDQLLPIVAKKHTLVFCNTRLTVMSLNEELRHRGHSVGSIEGQQDQSDRISILQRFRTGEIKTLIASDVIGRGIDVQQVFVVINYDAPAKLEEYIHRVGRAGRYGRKGVVITFVSDKDGQDMVMDLEAFYQTQIQELPANISDYVV